MPHRNLKDLKNLHSSLKKLSENSKSKHNFLVGDFDWPTSIGKHLQFVRPCLTAPDREVQQTLIDISIENGLSQIRGAFEKYVAWYHNSTKG